MWNPLLPVHPVSWVIATTAQPCSEIDLSIPFLWGVMATAFLLLFLFLVAVWGFGFKVITVDLPDPPPGYFQSKVELRGSDIQAGDVVSFEGLDSPNPKVTVVRPK